MKKKTALASILGILAALLAITHPSCGGGDNGGGTSPTQQTPQATLNMENVDDSLEYIAENVSGCSFGDTAKTQNKWKPIVDLSLEVSDQVKSMSISQQVGAKATETETEEFDGSCGGTIEVSLTSDDETGDLSGSLSFDNFCQDVSDSQSRINGYLEFSGKIDTETDELIQLGGSTEPEGITLEQDGDCYILAIQNANLDIEGDTTTATLDSFFYMPCSEVKKYRVENLTAQVTDEGTTTEITASGQFIHPEEGAVNFRTLQPIIISDDEEILSGQVEITGAGNTRALLTASGDNVFEVQADTDGDGVYDYFPDNLDCSEFDLDLQL